MKGSMYAYVHIYIYIHATTFHQTLQNITVFWKIYSTIYKHETCKRITGNLLCLYYKPRSWDVVYLLVLASINKYIVEIHSVGLDLWL